MIKAPYVSKYLPDYYSGQPLYIYSIVYIKTIFLSQQSSFYTLEKNVVKMSFSCLCTVLCFFYTFIIISNIFSYSNLYFSQALIFMTAILLWQPFCWFWECTHSNALGLQTVSEPGKDICLKWFSSKICTILTRSLKSTLYFIWWSELNST